MTEDGEVLSGIREDGESWTLTFIFWRDRGDLAEHSGSQTSLRRLWPWVAGSPVDLTATAGGFGRALVQLGGYSSALSCVFP